jgi:MoxR-like ATPase
MDIFTGFADEEIKEAASSKLMIRKGFYSDVKEVLAQIRNVILIDDQTIISMIAAINAGFNIILYGPPGTAKSTISKFIPEFIYGVRCNIHTADSSWNVRKVIGGLSVSYYRVGSEVHDTIKPVDGYIVEDILSCYKDHLQTTDFYSTFSIIDEFNRTNMDECLGPMFTAMGSDNKELKLDYYKGFCENFTSVIVPDSYRIICNMNKYDRTFTNELSEALSRRFKWIYVGPPSIEESETEEDLIHNIIFSNAEETASNIPEELEDISNYEECPFFNKFIEKRIVRIINDLRSDLEIGTAYKIDAIKIAYHYMRIAVELIDWPRYSGVSIAQLFECEDIDNLSNSLIDGTIKQNFVDDIKLFINSIIDAALVMTVIPTCEALEEPEAIEKNKERFADYPRCIKELERMKMIF